MKFTALLPTFKCITDWLAPSHIAIELHAFLILAQSSWKRIMTIYGYTVTTHKGVGGLNGNANQNNKKILAKCL